MSCIAYEGLEQCAGTGSRTLASLEHQWANDRERLTSKHILVIDEAGMIGTRPLQRVVTDAEKQGAKVVLVGDPEPLQALEAGAAFRVAAERHGAIAIGTAHVCTPVTNASLVSRPILELIISHSNH